MSKSAPKKKKETVIRKSSAAETALESIDQLVLLQGVFEDQAGLVFQKFLKWLDKDDLTQDGIKRYGKLWWVLAEAQTQLNHPTVGNLLQNYFLERLVENDNTFYRQAELYPYEKLSASFSTLSFVFV